MTGEENAGIGVYLLDKPAGPTSFQMVAAVRRHLGIRRVGHAGTLDPFASGLLIVCAGRPATRIVMQLMNGDKEYLAGLRLGVATDTLDPEGSVVATSEVPRLDMEKVQRLLASLLGESLQAPPHFSAVKHRGKPLYAYARRGIMIDKEPRTIKIHSLEAEGLSLAQDGGDDTLTFRVRCSKGTYIRSLAAEIAAQLGCVGHLVSLRRVASGPFLVDEALAGDRLKDKDAGRILLAHRLDIFETIRRTAPPDPSQGATETAKTAPPPVLTAK